jgi:2-haloacid dehalogenase
LLATEFFMDRRDFLRAAVVLGAAPDAFAQTSGAPSQAPPSRPPLAIGSLKVLVFDTFGTVVDWRSSVIAEGRRLAKSKRLQVDWEAFADAWRGGYGPSMNRVRKGELPWTNLDALHRMILDELLVTFKIEGLSEAEKDHLNRVWHRLTPWPDAVEGLTRLKRRFVIAPLSNGNVALLTNMAKQAGLPWDLILSTELVKRYKPDKETYLMAPEFWGVEPGAVMMVAAHAGDLQAAEALGLRTAFVYRPREFGPSRTPNRPDAGRFDVMTDDFKELASRLGA